MSFNLMIVDDNSIICGSMSKMLSKIDNIKVSSYSCPALAIEAVKKNKHPDIIITDVLMPVINGLDMLRMMREAGCMSPAIIFSGYKWDRKDIDIIVPQNHIMAVVCKSEGMDRVRQEVLHIMEKQYV